jgi:hypothetical protein
MKISEEVYKTLELSGAARVDMILCEDKLYFLEVNTIPGMTETSLLPKLASLKGYDFTITSSTAYDQKWIYGRNVFEEIDYLVDSIFTNYLSRPGVRQPIFTSYCDGNRTTCRGLSQWGSKSLADQGYSAIDIIHYYYGNDMYINSADIISGVPSSWPGYDLTIGSSGEKVRQLQQQLNRIARNYPAIPTLIPDGIYGPDTAEAVRMFQKIFHLPQTGIVDYPTWFEISDIYVGVTRISEPDV